MPRKKQLRMEGTEPERDGELDEAADTYYETMIARVKLTGKETEAMDALHTLMKKRKMTFYENDDLKVIVTSGKDKVSVKPVKKSEPDEDDE